MVDHAYFWWYVYILPDFFTWLSRKDSTYISVVFLLESWFQMIEMPSPVVSQWRTRSCRRIPYSSPSEMPWQLVALRQWIQFGPGHTRGLDSEHMQSPMASPINVSLSTHTVATEFDITCNDPHKRWYKRLDDLILKPAKVRNNNSSRFGKWHGPQPSVLLCTTIETACEIHHWSQQDGMRNVAFGESLQLHHCRRLLTFDVVFVGCFCPILRVDNLQVEGNGVELGSRQINLDTTTWHRFPNVWPSNDLFPPAALEMKYGPNVEENIKQQLQILWHRVCKSFMSTLPYLNSSTRRQSAFVLLEICRRVHKPNDTTKPRSCDFDSLDILFKQWNGK